MKGKNVSDSEFKKIQDETNKLMQSDTTAGKRLKELSDSNTCKVTINVVKDTEQGSSVRASNDTDACNGTGTDSTVDIDVTQEGSYGLFGPKLDIRATLAHELSGHAFTNYKGNSPINPNASKAVIEGSLKGLDESIAVSMENEYRDTLGLRQRPIYDNSPYAVFPMPLYNKRNNTWSLNGASWRLK